MSGNLVDTNVIIKVLNGNDGAVKLFDALDETTAANVNGKNRGLRCYC
jgi:hypothetical protein